MRKVLADTPEVLARLEAAHAAAWAAVDPHVLGLCQRRIASLLGFVDEDMEPWDPSRALDATEAACVAYTEQHVIDVAAMDDATVAAVADALGAPGLVDFANALLVVEQRIRLHLLWTTLFDTEDAA